MPRLTRSHWYDIARDMNWNFKYVSEEEVFPEEQSKSFDIANKSWWTWDEPYKLSYREYVSNQSEKDAGIYAVQKAISRSDLFDKLDPGWKSAIIAHYGAISFPEYTASIGEARMGRFGRAAAWRNMATYGALDELRHAQIQTHFAHALLDKEPRLDWTHKAFHTNEWGIIAARHLFDDMFLANDAVQTAIQLTFTFETGFSNLQFLGMAADAMEAGDIEFGSLISSIQTDEARHAQQGEPTLKILLENGKKEEAQKMIEVMFWRTWRIFALLTGASMDYYTPLEHRSMSFKEFMTEWVVKQFMDQFRDFGLEKPWYWDSFIDELDWYHHAIHLGIWTWRPTVWWNPDAGASVAERDWLEAKYPGWNERFGKYWDVITKNIRDGKPEETLPETLPIICNMCNIPVVSPVDGGKQPQFHTHEGRTYTFCTKECQWIFEQEPDRYKGHFNFIDRFLQGKMQPMNLMGGLAYMGISPEEAGVDATNYAWAEETELEKVLERAKAAAASKN